MKKFLIRYHKQIGFAVLTILLLSVSIVAFVTDTSRNMTNKDPILVFLVDNHTGIMFVLMVVSIFFGFFWSHISFRELQQKKRDSKKILEVVMLFLNKEEKEIIQYLVEKNGETTQAEISRLPGLNRVKAYRSLKKMEEKRLISIVPHGKIRKIVLKENINNTLLDQNHL